MANSIPPSSRKNGSPFGCRATVSAVGRLQLVVTVPSRMNSNPPSEHGQVLPQGEGPGGIPVEPEGRAGE